MPRPSAVNKDMDIFYQMAEELMTTSKTLKDIFAIPQKYSLNKEAFIYEKDNNSVTLTYEAYRKECYKYAKALSDSLKDISKGSYVALKISNSIKWPLCFWGLVISGYNPLLINAILNEEDTNKLINECGAKAIVSDSKDKYEVKSINVEELVINEELNNEGEWANEVAFCTSGTTGDSRIFAFSGENLSHQIMSAFDMPLYTDDIMYIEKYGKLRHLMIVPFSHIFGFVAIFLWFTFFGMCIVLPTSISSNDIVKFSKTYKISHIFAVPLFWDLIAKLIKQGVKEQSKKKQLIMKKFMDYNNGHITKSEAGIASFNFVRKKIQRGILGEHIRFGIAGGSVLSKDTLETINGVGYHLYNGYGMTEIGVTSVELSKNVFQRNKGSVGKPLFNVSYKLNNDELCVKAPQIHSYRFVNGEKEKALLDEEGYFHTGDIASIDNEGYTYIRGKLKDVIISSNGENIYPEELEKDFLNIDKISKAILIGDKSKGEEVLTLIIELQKALSKEEYKKLEDDIRTVSDSLPPSFRPVNYYLSLNPLPMNASLKVKRYVLEENLIKHPEQFMKLSRGENLSLGNISLEEISPVLEKIFDAYSEILGIDKKEINQNSHFVIDLGGDSFTYMSLISLIEEKFDIGVPSEELGKLNTPIEFALYIYKNKN